MYLFCFPPPPPLPYPSGDAQSSQRALFELVPISTTAKGKIRTDALLRLRHVATGRWVHFAMAPNAENNNELGGKEYLYIYVCIYECLPIYACI